MRILGIDPGSRYTGYGVIQGDRSTGAVYVTSGVITLGASLLTLPDRLQHIYKTLSQVILETNPDQVAVEAVFMGAANPSSALKLGQARGAAIVAAVSQDKSVFEYTAKQVKQSVCGYGAAGKQQIQKMIQHLLTLDFLPRTDAADALSVALCHFYMLHSPIPVSAGLRKGHGARKSRWRLASVV